MSNRAYDTKNAVDQDPRSKEQHQCRDSHNRMRKRDNSEDNCSDTPVKLGPTNDVLRFREACSVLETRPFERQAHSAVVFACAYRS